MDVQKRRYVVNDLGFGFAVHDTRAPAEYVHPAGRDKQHPSKNVFNTRMVEIFPTLAQAQAHADELEAREDAGRPG
jgi:hypothetical protein